MAADVRSENVKTDYLLTYPLGSDHGLSAKEAYILASSSRSRMDRCPVHTESVF